MPYSANPALLATAQGNRAQASGYVNSFSDTSVNGYQHGLFYIAPGVRSRYTANTWYDLVVLSNGNKMRFRWYRYEDMWLQADIYFTYSDNSTIFTLGWSSWNDSEFDEMGFDIIFFYNESYRMQTYHPDNSANQWTAFSNQAVRTFIEGAEPIIYNWSPVEQLAGNNGQFRMNLSQIKAEYIGDGNTETITTDPDHFVFSAESLIGPVITRLALNEETTILFSGENFATAKVTSITSNYLYTYNLKFYFTETTPILTITGLMTTPRDQSRFSFIIDRHYQAAAFDPIIIYENLQDETEYKYNDSRWPLPSAEDLLDLYVWLTATGEEIEGPYDTGTTDDGGVPGQPRPQDHIHTGPLPTTSGLDVGFLTLYQPTAVQLASIANFLWSDDVIDNIKKYFGNVSDNILALYSLPFTPEAAPFSGSALPSKKFKVGNCQKDDLTVKFVNTRYFDVDMGSVPIDKLWGAYLDYAPYTSCQVYLPYLGLHSLDIDELMSAADMDGYMPSEQGCTLSLLYRVDILTGIIVAQLKVSNSKISDEIRYQFSGKVGFNVPMTGQTYASLIQGIVTSGAGLISTLATSGMAAPMVAGSAALAGTIMAQKPNVERIGNISGDASMLSHQVPYIILSTPNKPQLIGQEKFTGFPSYKTGLLSTFSGYTECIDAHVEGITCTEEERAEIISLLKAGVII